MRSRRGFGLYAELPTEQLNPASKNLDQETALQIIRLMAREDMKIASAVAGESSRIARAAEIAAKALSRGRSLVFVGAGTSGRLGVLEAAECPPTFGTSARRIRAIMAGGNRAVFKSKEGAEDDLGAGQKAAKSLRPGDAVIGIAASGVTPFVLGALCAARLKFCETILITCNQKPPKSSADVLITLRVGPEVIAGSTRLKSGTATKMALNQITTAAMVRIGKVYGAWMVDLKPASLKLRLRAVRLVCQLGKVPLERARQLLKMANWRAKPAIVMARLGADFREAEKLLSKSGGSLRRVLEMALGPKT